MNEVVEIVVVHDGLWDDVHRDHDVFVLVRGHIQAEVEFFRSSVMYLALGVEITLLRCVLTVGRPAILVLLLWG